MSCRNKLLKILLTLFLASILLGCAGKTERIIHVYCGAGMQKPMDEIAKEFENEYGIKVICDYAGSGYLLAKITSTKSGDIFMPGDYLYIKKLEKEGGVLEYKNFTKHIPVIVVPKGNSKNITCLEDLGRECVRVALGDDNIAIGVAAKKIFAKAEKFVPGITEKIERNVVVRGATVKQVLLYVIEGQVDVGIVWRADALENSDKVDIIPINESYNVIKTVPIAILKYTKDEESARKFYNFVLTKGKDVFEKHGFVVLE
jgi:molybdate transport system substrate-binding protein